MGKLRSALIGWCALCASVGVISGLGGMCTGYAAERNNSELELVRREGKSGAEYEKRLVDVRDARNNSYGVAGFSVVGIGLGLAGLAGIEYSERKRG